MNDTYYGIERKKDGNGKNWYGVYFVIRGQKAMFRGVFPTRQKAVRDCQRKCCGKWISDYEIRSI